MVTKAAVPDSDSSPVPSDSAALHSHHRADVEGGGVGYRSKAGVARSVAVAKACRRQYLQMGRLRQPYTSRGSQAESE